MTSIDPTTPAYSSGHGHGHLCGQVGKVVTSITPPPTDLQGPSKTVELSRPMRYWIQRRLEQIGQANLDPMEKRLLELVQL